MSSSVRSSAGSSPRRSDSPPPSPWARSSAPARSPRSTDRPRPGGSASRWASCPTAGRPAPAGRPPRQARRGNPMAAQPPERKLTKAEAGRLGGPRTKAKHGTEHFRRAGRLGGKALLAKYGPEHYRKIGKAGFLALAIRIGLWNPRDVQSGRSRAIDFLSRQGKLKPRWRQFTAAELATLDAWLDRTFAELPT